MPCGRESVCVAMLCKGPLMPIASPVYHPQEPTDFPCWNIVHQDNQDSSVYYNANCGKQ